MIDDDEVALPFGKHKGEPIVRWYWHDILHAYWLLSQGFFGKRYPNEYSILEFLVSRLRYHQHRGDESVVLGNGSA